MVKEEIESNLLSKDVEPDFTTAKDPDTYISPNIFSQLLPSIEFIACSVVKRNYLLTLMQHAQRNKFQFIEKIVVINNSDDKRLIPWSCFLLF